ncbi:A24 family peptidase [Bradyrhizobium liaoningense]|uniref:prepilin peptidase n=1 Tax=Bradyrhizobium liaoningense TaxID=43992 RepID=UPI00201282A5|nr:A24 family peptidase [Bradyrhizobium liaoningense]
MLDWTDITTGLKLLQRKRILAYVIADPRETMHYNNQDYAREKSKVQSGLIFSLAMLVVVFASLMIAPGADGLLGAYLAALMLAIACNDARHYLIPNELTAAAFGLALMRSTLVMPNAAISSLLWVALRALAVGLPLLLLLLFYRHWRGREGLGLGDVKLAAVAGAWLELTTAAAVMELAALSAIATYVANAVVQKRSLRATAFLPFGLFLAPSIWIGWLGERLLLRWEHLLPG